MISLFTDTLKKKNENTVPTASELVGDCRAKAWGKRNVLKVCKL